MDERTTVSGARRRAIGMTTAITMAMVFGATSVAAQATGVTVQGTVEPCVISITSTEQVDLGPPSYDYDGGNFVFQHDEAISLNWYADGLECAGALHASRTAIVLEAATAVAGETSLTITSFGAGVDGVGDVDTLIGVGATPDIAVEVPTVSSSEGLEVFGVTMLIPLTSPPGLYSSTLTLTVVVE
jgi:hypothetical protein